MPKFPVLAILDDGIVFRFGVDFHLGRRVPRDLIDESKGVGGTVVVQRKIVPR